MRLTAKEDIEAPIAFVNSVLTDFDHWERAAMRRGAEVSRLDNLFKPGPGMEWSVAFDYRGKNRAADIKLLSLLAEKTLTFDCIAAPARAALTLEMTEMSAGRTRLWIAVEIKPLTLTARLFLQSLRLAKSKVTGRLSQRLSHLAADIEDRYRAQSKA